MCGRPATRMEAATVGGVEGRVPVCAEHSVEEAVAELRTKRCEWCEQPFTPKRRSDARTCSDKCRQAASRAARRASTRETGG